MVIYGRRIVSLFSLAAMCWALAACATATPSAMPTAIPPARTATYSPVPVAVTLAVRTTTATPTPSETPTPSATLPPSRTPAMMPTGLPTKQALLQFWWSIGGDGADVYGEYLGSLLPDLVLYTDGQLLSPARRWYQETTLTVSEMCGMLREIEATGLLQVVDPGGNNPGSSIYQFDDTTQFSDGGPSYVIQVNGAPAVQVTVYEPYAQYVLPSVRDAHNLFSHYTFQERLAAVPYISQQVLVWVELGRGTEWAWRAPTYGDGPEPTPEIDSWPSDLPPLADLLPNAQGTPAYIQGPLARAFASLPKRFGVYKDRDREYFVIVRPLLPHETAASYGLWPSGATEYALPLTCD